MERMHVQSRMEGSQYCALVRPIGRILLTMRVQPLLSGLDKVSAHAMSGREVWSGEFKDTEECRVLEVRKAIRDAAVLSNLCTCQSTLDLVRVDGLSVSKPLRGNHILKAKRIKPRQMPTLIDFSDFVTKKGRQQVLTKYWAKTKKG